MAEEIFRKYRWLSLIGTIGFIGLAGCGPTDEERAHVREALPAGCALHDLGSYGEITSLVVVTCDGRQTQSANWRWSTQCGKARCSHNAASAVIRS